MSGPVIKDRTLLLVYHWGRRSVFLRRASGRGSAVIFSSHFLRSFSFLRIRACSSFFVFQSSLLSDFVALRPAASTAVLLPGRGIPAAYGPEPVFVPAAVFALKPVFVPKGAFGVEQVPLLIFNERFAYILTGKYHDIDVRPFIAVYVSFPFYCRHYNLSRGNRAVKTSVHAQCLAAVSRTVV